MYQLARTVRLAVACRGNGYRRSGSSRGGLNICTDDEKLARNFSADLARTGPLGLVIDLVQPAVVGLRVRCSDVTHAKLNDG